MDVTLVYLCWFYRDLGPGYFLEKYILEVQERLFCLWGFGGFFLDKWTFVKLAPSVTSVCENS